MAFLKPVGNLITLALFRPPPYLLRVELILGDNRRPKYVSNDDFSISIVRAD